MQQLQKFKKTELGKIPENWSFKKIGELLDEKIILEIQDGNHGELHPKFADFIEKGIPFLTANCISNNRISFDNCKYLSESWLKKLRIGFAKENDVILTHKGTLGLCAIVPSGIKNIILSPQTTYYRLTPKISSIFLFYFFQSNIFQSQLFKIGKQSTRDYVGITSQKALFLVIPPLKEQQKIASILSNVDELIQKTEEIIEQTRRLKNGLINKLVTTGFDIKENSHQVISDNYKFVKLTDVVDINPSYKIEKNKEYQYIEMAAINENTKTIKYFNKRKPSSGYAVFKNNDTLFARITPCTENGKNCLVTDINGYGLGSTELIVLSPKEEILPEFLCYYCQTDKVRSYAISQMAGATGRQRVPYKVFTEDLFIVIPDKKNQQQIVNTIREIENIIKFNSAKKDNMQNLKKGLMQQLLTGKLRVKA